MDETFDPYRKWLGIPPEEQPPHHYRLLGLELFEEDPDVIVNAADARLTFLQTFVGDEHADMAERIAAHIKEVQLCLLDPAKKAFYDGQLQRRIAALKKQPPATTRPSEAGSSSAMLQEKWADFPVPSLPPQSAAGRARTPPSLPAATFPTAERQPPAYARRSAHSSPKRWQLLAAMMFGLAAVGCLLVFLWVKFRRVEETVSTTTLAHVALGVEKPHNTKAVASTERAHFETPKMPEKNEEPSTNGEKNPRRKGESSTVVRKPKEDSGPRFPPLDTQEPVTPKEKRPQNPFEVAEKVAEDPTRREDAKNDGAEENVIDLKVQDNRNGSASMRGPFGKRQPVPAEKARQAAEKSVRDIYGMKIAAAKTMMEKGVLAAQIWSQAMKTVDDAAARYALMSLACQLAGDSGQLAQMTIYADMLANYFEVDPWELKAQSIQGVARAALAAQTARTNALKFDSVDIVLTARQFAEEAKQAGQVEVAQKVVKAIAPLAKKDPLLMREVNAFGREVDKLAARYQPVRKAFDTLKTEPDNAEANTLAGRWLCFESREWGKGLPMLAKSSDAALISLAAKDIATSKAAESQVATADAWWDFAQKEKGNVKASSLARAEFWYECALPNLNGLNRTKANERMQSIFGVDVSTAAGRGAIQKGNVALASNGTCVEGVRANAEKLFDGDSKNPAWDGGAASGPVPCEWTITFDKVYQLQQIRFHFYDGDARFYRYLMSVSADGVNYQPLIDRTRGQSFKWQIIPLGGKPVKTVKLVGTFSYRNHPFSVTEFEAYCIPPRP